MADKLDDNTPLIGITEDDSRPAPSDQDTLLGRLLDPKPVHDAATERGDMPNLVTGLIAPLTGQAEERDPDADEGTTDSSQA